MTTQLYTHDIFVEHLTPQGHPERPDRMRAVAKALSDESFDGLERHATELADDGLFALAHPQAYVAGIRDIAPQEGRVRVDADTTMSPKSWDCVRHAVGGGIAAIDAVFAKQADNAFISARPHCRYFFGVVAMGAG